MAQDAVGNPKIHLSSGDQVQVRALSGVVADDQRSADTRFYSVGGGGYVGPHGGSVAAPQIRSVTDKRQTIWITDDSGRDHSLALKNVSIPLRVGQRVTALYCHFESTNVERCELVVNHSSQLQYCLARESKPLIDFESRYRRSSIATVLVFALFAGAVLFWVGLYRQTSEDDLRRSSLRWNCVRITPGATKVPARVRELVAQRHAECERLMQQAAAAEGSIWGTWWLPIGCTVAWLYLVIEGVGRKAAYGRRLFAEYLAALENWPVASPQGARTKLS